MYGFTVLLFFSSVYMNVMLNTNKISSAIMDIAFTVTSNSIC